MNLSSIRRTIAERVVTAFLLNIVLLLTACTPVPTKQEVTDMIVKYFNGRGYAVPNIEISELTSIPLGEKTYMGRKAYTVGIRSITLLPKEDIGPPWNYRKGEQLNFKDAIMRLKEGTRKDGTWGVEVVSGIPVF